ncbi:MAG: trigger factor, partial [Patescibacteria group bacterium]
ELTITLEADEIQSELAAAAARISEQMKLDGFRPGKAPYDVVKQKTGEMAIWQEAAEDIVRHSFVKAIMQENVATVGQPQIELVTFAPGNPLVYKATAPILPGISKLADYRSISVARKSADVSDADVDRAIEELRRMQTREQEIDRPATDKDKIVVDMHMFLDNVPLDGGQTKNHGVVLSEEAYVPGLTKELTGLKKGDEKTFTLPFPADHFQKNIAGKNVEFKVRVSSVVELTPPELNDAFAATLGQKTVAELKTLLKSNLESEAKEKEEQRVELEMLEKIVDKTTFDDIPDQLVTQETTRMVEELGASLKERGMEFGEYLRSLKKSRQDIQLDFAPQAIRRVKTAIVIRDIGRAEKIEADDAEVMKHVEEAMNHYKQDPEAQKHISSEDYAESLKIRMRNRKTIEFLRDLIVK